MKILFLLKKRNSYGGPVNYSTFESGLLNSAKMTMDQLVNTGMVEADLRVCIDGNGIDKELFQYKPDVCIIEALWVTPTKLKELVKLHPNVVFIIRIHSETPFLANEGNSVNWCKQYSQIPHVQVAFNSKRVRDDFREATGLRFSYLPNIYERVGYKSSAWDFYKAVHNEPIPNVLDIGCFGAIRPMKNQLQQAISAIVYANRVGSILRFHINVPRTEQGGESVLKNLRALFEDIEHKLVEHGWLPRKEFLDLVSTMDAGMQVSLNESFNIVTADFVSRNVPIVVSQSIDWMPEETHVDTEETSSIIKGLNAILSYPRWYARKGRKALVEYNRKALITWLNFLF